MNDLQKLEVISQQLLDLVQHEQIENRDVLIEEITKKLDVRDVLLASLNRPFNDEEKIIGERIIKQNEIISKKLAFIFDDIKKDIISLKKQKNSNNRYINPYTNISDGMFFDKKK